MELKGSSVLLHGIDTKPIKITNSTNEPLQYRLVIEKSNRTNLDVSFFINEAEKLILYKGVTPSGLYSLL